jgi:hypothetical protein
MSRVSRSARLLQNAEAALISAIEIYNKPSFGYREETFAILALNAWELLLKAKVLEQHNNAINSLTVFATRQTASGKQSKKRYAKLNRSGNRITIGIDSCIDVLTKKGISVPEPVRKNLEALTEIRDNAVHYINASPQLSKQVLEIGTACLRNFIELGKLWVSLDLSSYSLYLMPIGFLPTEPATAMTISNNEQKVVNYLARVMKDGSSASDQDYHVSLDVNISFKRTSIASAAAVIVTNDPTDPNATKVALSEEDIRKQYPWDYATLTEKLNNRYIDFKNNAKYHALRKKIATNPQFMKTRFLDPSKQGGLRKDFFNPNIIAEFDKVYTRRI